MTKAALTKKVTKKPSIKSGTKKPIQKQVESIKNSDKLFKNVLLVLFVACLIIGLALANGTQPIKTTGIKLPASKNNPTVLAESHTAAPNNDKTTPSSTNADGIGQAATYNSHQVPSHTNPPVAQQSSQPITSIPTSTQPTDSVTTPVPTQTPAPDPLSTPPVQAPDPIPTTKPDNLLHAVGNLVHSTLQYILTI